MKIRTDNENSSKEINVTNNKATSDSSTTFDDILTSVGQMGLYQRGLFVLLGIAASTCALHMLGWVFLGVQAAHRCLLPFETPQNATFQLSPSILANYNRLYNNWSSSCKQISDGGVEISCKNFVFDTSVYRSSAVFEFNLVCENAWLRALVDTGLMLGTLVSSPVFGSLSDTFGRRHVFFCAVLLQICSGVVASVAPNFWSFVIARFILGTTVPGVYMSAFVIGMELVGPSRRQVAGVTMNVFFSLGYGVCAALAKLVQHDWRLMQFAFALPGLICLIFWKLIPESPRWLISQGRVAEASIILHKVAKINGAPVSSKVLDNQLAVVAETAQHLKDAKDVAPPATLLGVARDCPALRRCLVIFLLIWCMNNLSYFGLSFNSGSLGGNLHVNFLISGAVEVPAYIVVVVAVEIFGRRPVQSFFLLLSGGALIASAALTSVVPWWVLTTLAMLGKFAVTASVGASYIFSAETLPTCVRSAGMGACAMAAGVGAMTAPLVLLLTELWSPLPPLVLGGTALLVGVLALWLPETLGRNLPETLEDGEVFCRKNRRGKNTSNC